MTERELNGLVARGLQRYRAGDIDGALTAWEHALALDPAEPRALGYVDYVRQNYDALVGRGPGPISESSIPLGLRRSDDDYPDAAGANRPPPSRIADGVAFDRAPGKTWPPTGPRDAVAATVDVRRASSPKPDSAPHPPTPRFDPNETRNEADDETGDETGDFQQPIGSPTATFGAEAPTVGGTYRRLRALSTPASNARGTQSPSEPTADEDDQSGEATIEFGALASDYATGDISGERTLDRSAAARLDPEILRGLGIAPPGERLSTADEETRQQWPNRGPLDIALPTPGGDLVIEAIEPPPRNPRFDRFEGNDTANLKSRVSPDDDRSNIEVEDLLLPPPSGSLAQVDDDADTGDSDLPVPDQDELTAGLSASIDARAPEYERPDERARRRIVALLERAVFASRSGEHPIAVAAIDLAMSEAPGLAAAQKLVYKSRDEILDCYHRFFGDLGRRPVVVASYEELTRRPLDPRAAFLLSRIDGAISFDEVLDVAGMGRLEACRYLADLLCRGLIKAS